MNRPGPPGCEEALLRRARALSGATLGQLARDAGAELPATPARRKGLAGRLLEERLGATAGSRGAPDFEALGVELKTLPVRGDGRPLESTWVCHLPAEAGLLPWEASPVRRKLARVLWVPLEGSRAIPWARRRVGTAFLWSPDAAEAELLAADWCALTDRVLLDGADAVSAHEGAVLQLRPKAAHGGVRVPGLGADGQATSIHPRGFYLRARFTAQILARHLHPGTSSRP